MTRHFKPASATLLGLILLGSTASAQTLLSGDHSITGSLCVGTTCTLSEPTSPTHVLKLKSTAPWIYFEDTSSTGASRDWRILTSGLLPDEYFGINDVDSGTVPFKIIGKAPTDSFYLDENGFLGLGTSMPARNIHITTADTPVIRMEQTATINSPAVFEVFVNETGFAVSDVLADTVPFAIDPGAPDDAMVVAANGNMGLGTSSPAAQFEMSSTNAFNFFRISATGATVNESVDITFTGGPLGTGQLRYNIVDGDNQEMSLDADGNMVLDGTLTTAGPTCAGGCDRVFDADYALPSVMEHGQQMFELGHLPSVGATLPHAPVNLSERQGKIINAVEHAHIYVYEQQQEITELRSALSDMQMKYAQLQTQLDALMRE